MTIEMMGLTSDVINVAVTHDSICKPNIYFASTALPILLTDKRKEEPKIKYLRTYYSRMRKNENVRSVEAVVTHFGGIPRKKRERKEH